MVSRLSSRFPSAFMRGALSPIVQTVVVEHKIAFIETRFESHDDYSELRGERGGYFPDEAAGDTAKRIWGVSAMI